MTVNIKKIRLVKNAFEVPVEPRLGDTAYFQGSGEFTKKSETNNQDGTCNVVYDLKPDLIEIKSTDALKADITITKDFIKDKSRSQKHRDLLYKLWVEIGSQGSFEGYYNSIYDAYDKKVSELIDQEVMGL